LVIIMDRVVEEAAARTMEAIMDTKRHTIATSAGNVGRAGHSTSGGWVVEEATAPARRANVATARAASIITAIAALPLPQQARREAAAVAVVAVSIASIATVTTITWV